jgi:hypothetical protein
MQEAERRYNQKPMDFSRFSPLQRRVLILLLAALLALGVYELLPGTRLRAKHAELIEWAQSGAPRDFREDFAAPNYSDQWEQSVDEVVERMRMVRFGFPGVTIKAEEPEFSRSGDTATVEQVLDIRGADTPRKAAFTFRWKRQSWLPWSWRLERVDAPEMEL